MQVTGKAKRVRIYIGESDKWKHKPLHTAILEMLKAQDCAGATVTRAISGFGAHSRIHTASLVDLSSDLPLVVEWVDNPHRVERVMPHLQEIVLEGLITVEEVEVLFYSHRDLRQLGASLPVHDIMNRELHTVQANTPLIDAVELLLDKRHKALPVLDENGHVVGILTDGDLLRKADLFSVSTQQQLTKHELDDELQRLRRIDKTVLSVMTANPVTITGDTTVPHAVELMLQHQIKRLPVVDTQNRLIGIVSRVDVLRAVSLSPVEETAGAHPPPGRHTTVQDVMNSSVPTVQADASLADVVALLVNNAQRRVVVVDTTQQVVGIITDGDLIARATPTERPGIIQSLSHRLNPQADGFKLNQRTVAQVMTSPVITASPSTPLLDALQLLLTHAIKRLPVVDAQGKLVGLIGRGTILQAIGQNTGLNVPRT